jgi:hypothetical protein
MDFLLDQFRANPVRYINYGALAVLWVATRVAAAAGVTIPADSDIALAILTVVTFILTELARRFVTAPKTAATEAAAAADALARQAAEHEAEVAAILTPEGAAVESVAVEP